MLTIPKELQQAVRASHGRPLRLTDPETHAEYVLLHADMYDQLHRLLYHATPLTPDERRAVLIQAGLRAGWDDPEMDVDNALDPRVIQCENLLTYDQALILRVLGRLSATAMEQMNTGLKAALGIP